ncbi:MAG: SH3 domain-containing protein [Kaiparowitsia implicata GSE-PSE-MK54-09C]|jgi:uncharacterized protein YraI|nr:SH3 domain-containing protein [Kaiparowitsia implicata GSE-PSE-MK54-09C]
MNVRTWAIAPSLSIFGVVATAMVITAGESASVNVGTLNLRSGPGTQFAVLQFLQRGDWVSIHNRSGDWVYVTDADGRTGWVFEPFLTSNYVNGGDVELDDIRSSILGTSVEYGYRQLYQQGYTFLETLTETETVATEAWMRQTDGAVLHLMVEDTAEEESAASRYIVDLRRIQ